MNSIQPIDIGTITFKLRFHDMGYEHFIDPPIGWDKMPIELKRADKYARKIKFGEDQEVEFWKSKPIKLGHRFDEIINCHKKFGDESFIELIIFVDDEEFMRAELDVKNSTTDRESYFKCKLLINDLSKKIDDLKDTKINVFGEESLLGNPNPPAESDSVILMPKKIRERSRHEIGDEDQKKISEPMVIDIGGSYQNVGETLDMGNPYGLLLIDQSDVAETYFVPSDQVYVNSGPGNNVPSTYTGGSLSNTHNLYFKVQTDVIIKAENVHIKVDGTNVRDNNTRIIFQIASITYDNENLENVIEKKYINIKTIYGKEALINETIQLSVPKFTRFIYEYRVYIGGRTQTPDERLTLFDGGSITADTVGLYPASRARMTRLINAGKKILSNYTENAANIIAPKFFEDGPFWWYYITNGYFIRGFLDSSFDVSWKEWKDFVQTAFNCDVQINGNNVFIGRHEDFYRNVEVARFPFKPDVDSYEITFNDDLIVNNLNIGYEQYEDEEYDTMDAFHTESEWFIPKRNKGSLDIKIPFTADGYSIEYARREGIDAEPTTAKKKDDDIYIIDCFLNKIVFPPPFPATIYLLQNRQSQGFSLVEGIFSPETAYNLRLSLKRLLLDHYKHRIAEIGQKLNNGIPIPSTQFAKNTFFKANGNLKTQANLDMITTHHLVIDEADITKSLISQPLIGSEIYEFTLSMRIKFKELVTMYKRIINENGYITLFTDDIELKFYPFDMSYDEVQEQLKIKAERKYEI